MWSNQANYKQKCDFDRSGGSEIPLTAFSYSQFIPNILVQ